MKKALAITAGLLLVLSLSASYLVTALAAPQEQLQYTEHGIYGDLSAAEGLLLTRTLRLGKNMRWTSSLQFAEGSCRRETLLEETGEDLWRQDMQSRQAVTYGARLYSELCTLASMQMNSEMAMGKEGSIAKAIFDRTPAGESRTEQVLLKEYLDHYPIMWEVYSENVDVYMAGLSLTEDELLDPQTKQVLRDLEAFFRIPVLPQQCMYLAVEKDAAGNFLQCYEAFGQEAEPLLTERYDFSGSGVFAKDNCFLWFDNRTSFGNTVDTGLIPGGYGIYILPTGITGYEELRSGGTRPVWGILSDQLRVFYSLDPEDTVLQVEVSENEENLLALVRRGGHAFALVIDAKTGEPRSSTDLGVYGEDTSYWIEKSDPYMILCWGDSLCLLAQEEDGVLRPKFCTASTDVEQQADYYPIRGMLRYYACDGNRLVIAGSLPKTALQQENDPDFWFWGDSELCGFYVAVYTEEGLQYYGLWECSLDQVRGGEDPRFDQYGISSEKYVGPQLYCGMTLQLQ